MLTASGGPFRGRSRDELHDVTPEQALAHPTWDMGPVVTINSATLVNKGLEVIEAHLLFGIPFDRIEVVVHPTSVVHSMVEFVDGSTLAQASPADDADPDRARPGLARPGARRGARRWTGRRPQTWEFFPLDDEAFPAVRLAREAGARGGTAPAVYNAANEVCVEAFRDGGLRFAEIVAHGRPCARRPRRTLGADGSHRRRRAGGRRLGPRRRPRPRDTGRAHSMTALMYTARRAALRRRRRWPRSACTSSATWSPAKLFGVKVTQYFIGFGRTLWSRQARRDRVRRQGDPARRLRASSSGCCRPARTQRPERPVRGKSNTGMFAQLITDARAAEYELVEPGDEDRLFYKMPWWKKVVMMAPAVDDQPGARVPALRGRLHGLRRSADADHDGRAASRSA